MARMVSEPLQQSIQFLDAGGKSLTEQESDGDTTPAQRTCTHLYARLPARIPTPNPPNQRLETTGTPHAIFPL